MSLGIARARAHTKPARIVGVPSVRIHLSDRTPRVQEGLWPKARKSSKHSPPSSRDRSLCPPHAGFLWNLSGTERVGYRGHSVGGGDGPPWTDARQNSTTQRNATQHSMRQTTQPRPGRTCQTLKRCRGRSLMLLSRSRTTCVNRPKERAKEKAEGDQGVLARHD